MPLLLIVDDEHLIRKGLVRIVERVAPQWKVIGEATNGLDAIDYVHKIRPNLIISDIKMPEMDGIQMAKKLNAEGIHIPVIFLTGYDDFGYAQQAVRIQAHDYLLKPLRQNDLQMLLDRFLKEFYKPVGRSLPASAFIEMKQFEFKLINALETNNSSCIYPLIQQKYQDLIENVSLHLFLNEIIRIVNTFFMKHGIYGLEHNTAILLENEEIEIKMIAEKIGGLLHLFHQSIQQSKDVLIEQAQEFIRNHLDESVTLESVAKHIHLNPTYFSEYYKVKTGETFSHYIARIRIEEAKHLLQYSSLKVQEVAQRLGYIDARYFSKMFKLWVGITPKQYREKVKSTNEFMSSSNH